MWLQKQLHAMYDEIASEPLPNDLLNLIDTTRRMPTAARVTQGKSLAARRHSQEREGTSAGGRPLSGLHQTETACLPAKTRRRR